MRRKMSKRKDSAVFRNTARRTRALNLSSVKVSRGGIRLWLIN